MGARIRVKADSIIDKFEKFEIVSKKALELESDYNSVSRQRHNLRYKKFALENPIKNGRDAYYHSLWIGRHHSENFVGVLFSNLKSLSDIAKLSDDDFVEVDQSDCRLLDEFDITLFEKSYKDKIAECVNSIEELSQEIEDIENKKNYEEKEQERKEQNDKYKSETDNVDIKSTLNFWIPCAALLTIAMLTIVIIGG